MNSNGFRFTVQLFAAAVVWLMMAGCQSVPEATASRGGARVAAVRGGARCSDASHSWHKLSAGDTLTTGDLIQTALTSAVDIAVGDAGGTDANRILLQSDTVLFVEELPGALATEGGDASLRLHLRLGELTFTSPPSGKGSVCEISFENGLAGTRGATFKLRSDGQLRVFHGVVVLKSFDDKPARTIPAGNQYDPQTGELTPIPVGHVADAPTALPAARPSPPQWPPWPARKY